MSGPKILKHHILNSNFLLLFSWWTCFRHHRMAIHTSLGHTRTHLTALFPGLDFTEARDSEWQWHQLGNMQVCTWLQTDNHSSTPPLSFFTGRMPFLPPNQQRQSTESKKVWKTTEGMQYIRVSEWIFIIRRRTAVVPPDTQQIILHTTTFHLN